MTEQPLGYAKVHDHPEPCCPWPRPTWRQRRKAKLRHGDVVQCSTCDKRWRLVHTGYDDSDWWEWQEVSA